MGSSRSPAWGEAGRAEKAEAASGASLQACSKPIHWQGRSQVQERFRQENVQKHDHHSSVSHHRWCQWMGEPSLPEIGGLASACICSLFHQKPMHIPGPMQKSLHNNGLPAQAVLAVMHHPGA